MDSNLYDILTEVLKRHNKELDDYMQRILTCPFDISHLKEIRGIVDSIQATAKMLGKLKRDGH
jgi:hypothetical protein